jgi:2-polyprenyl-3-methyl-5-hydroxy-6-metoxy-1,4-benzoquinol methylase
VDLKEEAALGEAIDSHWYYVSKARMLEAHIPDRNLRLLDVGAGAGWFSRWLLRRGTAAHAVCVDPGYPEDREEIVEGRPILFRRSVEATDADVVLLMDVLEHVDDDVKLLSDYMRIARPGTRFFITVPAFMFLWSAHDDYLEHRRRYTLDQLLRTVEKSGASTISTHYYFASIFPIAAAVRLLQRQRPADHSDMKPAPGWLNRILIAILSIERVWMRLNRFAGLTVVCLCQK